MMLPFTRSKRFANLVIDDYAVRAIESHSRQLTNIKQFKERPIPSGLIQNGKVADEIQLFDFMKQLVSDWKLKRCQARLYIPESLVIMRHVEFPANLEKEEIIDYFNLEIGQSIHLPFVDPVFDIHPLPDIDGAGKKQKGMLFAAPEEEVRKYTDLLDDSSLHPQAADVRPLGIYRYFHHMDYSRNGEVYLLFELNLLSLNISIFREHQMEFTRYQQLDLDAKDWSYTYKDEDLFNWRYTGDGIRLNNAIDSQISELERIMNFYRYSLHKGEKQITQIIITGDQPDLDNTKKKIQQRYELPVKLLKAYLSPAGEYEADIRFVPALGLALKGGE